MASVVGRVTSRVEDMKGLGFRVQGLEIFGLQHVEGHGPQITPFRLWPMYSLGNALPISATSQDPKFLSKSHHDSFFVGFQTSLKGLGVQGLGLECPVSHLPCCQVFSILLPPSPALPSQTLNNQDKAP